MLKLASWMFIQNRDIYDRALKREGGGDWALNRAFTISKY